MKNSFWRDSGPVERIPESLVEGVKEAVRKDLRMYGPIEVTSRTSEELVLSVPGVRGIEAVQRGGYIRLQTPAFLRVFLEVDALLEKAGEVSNG